MMTKIEIKLIYSPETKTIRLIPELSYFDEKDDDLKRLYKSATYYAIDWINILARIKGFKLNIDDLKITKIKMNKKEYNSIEIVCPYCGQASDHYDCLRIIGYTVPIREKPPEGTIVIGYADTGYDKIIAEIDFKCPICQNEIPLEYWED